MGNYLPFLMKILKLDKVVKQLKFQNYALYKSLKRKTKDKKGATAIEIMIGMIAFIIVLCLLVDLMVIGWKFAVISQTNSYVTRTAGLQGGILAKAPSGFPGGNTAYISSSEMKTKISNKFAGAGVKSGEYTVKVNGYNVGNGSSTNEIDYRGTITTDIEVKYKWDLSSNFIPGAIQKTISSSRSSMSEFKYRYDEWVGE